jgi:hypothetical protein
MSRTPDECHMHRFAKLLALSLVAGIAYIVWPIYSALQIREAMVAGDAATLDRKVEWEDVRASLKASMSAEALARLEADPDTPKPSLWQRVKAAVAPRMASTVIDRYITPKNFPVFLGYRRFWRGSILPALQPFINSAEPPTALASTWLGGTVIDRFVSFYGRIRKAVFKSMTRFDLEVADKYRPDRSYTGTMELRGFDWKLTGLTVSGTGY